MNDEYDNQEAEEIESDETSGADQGYGEEFGEEYPETESPEDEIEED